MKGRQKMNKVDLKIINGKIVTQGKVKNTGVAIRGGRIVAIANDEFLPEADKVIDARGKYIIPGVVDPEGHPGCYVPLQQDLHSETRAVAAMGTTTWGIQGPSTRMGQKPFKPVSEPADVVTFQEVFEDFKGAIKEESMIDIFLTPMVETDAQASQIYENGEKIGVTSNKLYLHCKRPELDKYWAKGRAGLITGFDDGTVYLAMKNTTKLGDGAILCMHCENWEVGRILERELQEEGRTDWAAWSDRSPGYLEAQHVAAYGFFAKQFKTPIYIQHASCPETFEEIRKLRRDGVTVHAQTGPAWLMFNKHNGWRINVPIRDEDERISIWDAIAEGIVDSIGSDAVVAWEPCGKEDLFNEDIWKLRTGFTSRGEALLPTVLSEGVSKGRITIEKAVEITSENPAKIFGLYPKKGCITVGADADLVVVDMDKKVKVGKNVINTRSGWSLWEGQTMKGWPVMTILRGKVLSEWKEGDKSPTIYDEKRIGEYLYRIPGKKLYSLEK